MSWRALLVGDTGGRLPDTAHLGGWVGEEARVTGAPCFLLHHLADGVGSAGGQGRIAGVVALVVDARLGGRAVGVDLAAHLAHVVQADVAKEAVVVQAAGQHTLAVLASLVGRAVAI